jgi:hypothetical protein
METLKPLWAVEDLVLSSRSSAEREVWNHYKTLDDAGRRLYASQNKLIGIIQEVITSVRTDKRGREPDLDMAYVRQGYRGKPATSDGYILFQSMAQPNTQP